MRPDDSWDRHARLHGLLEQRALLLGNETPTALGAGHDRGTHKGLGHGLMPRLNFGPHDSTSCPVELGDWSMC
jgi:hypothetical protein